MDVAAICLCDPEFELDCYIIILTRFYCACADDYDDYPSFFSSSARKPFGGGTGTNLLKCGFP